MSEHSLPCSRRSADAGNGLKASGHVGVDVVAIPADAPDPVTVALAETVASFESRRRVALRIHDACARSTVLYRLRQALEREVRDLLGV
jgi:hypothetical protein